MFYFGKKKSTTSTRASASIASSDSAAPENSSSSLIVANISTSRDNKVLPTASVVVRDAHGEKQVIRFCLIIAVQIISSRNCALHN